MTDPTARYVCVSATCAVLQLVATQRILFLKCPLCGQPMAEAPREEVA